MQRENPLFLNLEGEKKERGEGEKKKEDVQSY